MSKSILPVVIGIFLVGWGQPILAAKCVQPTTCDPTFGCVNAGPPYCSPDPMFNTLYETLGHEDPAYWPPGNEGGGYVEQEPNTHKLECNMSHYAPVKWQPGYSDIKEPAWAWLNPAQTIRVVTQTNVAPAGYPIPVAGVTNTLTKTTVLFNRANNPYNGPWSYIDPSNQAGGVITINVNWTSIQMGLAVAAHEAVHQQLNGGTNESLYNGYGKQAVDAYNADGSGAACAGVPNF